MKRSFSKLPLSYYLEANVEKLAIDLLGKQLVTNINGQLTAGIIVETEAYSGRNDKACHANNGKRTSRTEIFYHNGGVAYVYLIYGMHHLFNIVTNVQDEADAVLVRAIEPTEGISHMQMRRKMNQLKPSLTSGPGSLSKALGIHKNQHYGTSLIEDIIWLEETGIQYSPKEIISSPRVGVGYAEEDALRPWRFRVKNNKWTSPAK